MPGLLSVLVYLLVFIVLVELLNYILIVLVQIYFKCAYMSLCEIFLAFSTDLTKPAALFSSAMLRMSPRKSSMACSAVCMCTTNREAARDNGLGSFAARSAISA